MTNKCYLVMEDSSVYEGQTFGAQAPTFGEVVFNTSMTGYQEILTDPSYAGQIVVLTYPLVGNYGINSLDFESHHPQVAGFAVKEHCLSPSHKLSDTTLHEFLESHSIPGISGLDTRAITRRLRTQGVMMGILSQDEPGVSLRKLKELPQYGEMDLVREVSTEQSYDWERPLKSDGNVGPRVLVIDCGLKFNILRLLRKRGCQVTVVPANTPSKRILELKADALVLSPGPGDPSVLNYIIANTTELLGRLPMLGICLGHQVIARALGAKTFKLKFGHRGANHPVQELETGRVNITAQNHGYAVDADSLPTGLEVTHVNLNDQTVEGLRHRELPILTIQYHSEASPGPKDNEYLFDRFLSMVSHVETD